MLGSLTIVKLPTREWLGGAGVRKMALFRKLARRTGRELVTLQVGLEWSWMEVWARSWLCTKDSVPENVI